MKIIYFTTTILFLFAGVATRAQNIPLNNAVSTLIEAAISHTNQRFHSDVKPFLKRDVDSVLNSDSLLYQEIRSNFTKTWFGRKLLNEHFLQVQKPGYSMYVDPLFNFEAGYDVEGSRNAWVNTRGLTLSGNIGKQFAFETRFFENQAVFIRPLDSLFRRLGLIPGQGTFKKFKTNGLDYFMSEANISYSPSKYFNFQLGQGKNFIGDGYRSLLLSDASFGYPHLKITADVWVLKYTALYAQFQDLRIHTYPGKGAHARKYGIFHYLSAAITPSLTLGFFESVIWASLDSADSRGFELAYLNPVVFLRPVEETYGSADNALMGATASLKIFPELKLYAQFIMDELRLENVRKQNGWWANKFGYQFGAKGFDIFNIAGLSYRTEVNIVRPYTYTHSSSIRNYGNFNQPLAHPQGANFNEVLAMAAYSPNRLSVSAKLVAITYGADSSRLNFGGDIFQSYNTYVQEFNNTIAQGLKTTLLEGELRGSYMLNPRNRMMLEAIVNYRKLENTKLNQRSLFLGISFKTSVSNLYYDFF